MFKYSCTSLIHFFSVIIMKRGPTIINVLDTYLFMASIVYISYTYSQEINLLFDTKKAKVFHLEWPTMLFKNKKSSLLTVSKICHYYNLSYIILTAPTSISTLGVKLTLYGNASGIIHAFWNLILIPLRMAESFNSLQVLAKELPCCIHSRSIVSVVINYYSKYSAKLVQYFSFKGNFFHLFSMGLTKMVTNLNETTTTSTTTKKD